MELQLSSAALRKLECPLAILIPGPLWLGVVTPDTRAPAVNQIDLSRAK